MTKVVIRRCGGPSIDDQFVQAMNPGARKAVEIAAELNVFFSSEGLPYVARGEEENDQGTVRITRIKLGF